MNLVWAPQGHRRGTGLHVMPLCCSIARHALTEAIIGSIESPDADLGKWPAGKRTNGRTPPFALRSSRPEPPCLSAASGDVAFLVSDKNI